MFYKNLDSLEILFLFSLSERVSDLHFEPFEKETLLRMRKDGILEKVTLLSKGFYDLIINKIKILTQKMSLTQKRVPAEGSFDFTLDQQEIRVRVSSLLTFYGESLCLRILYSKRCSEFISLKKTI